MCRFERLKTGQITVKTSQCVQMYLCGKCVYVCAYTRIPVVVCVYSVCAAEGYLSCNDTVRTEKAIATVLQGLASLFN